MQAFTRILHSVKYALLVFITLATPSVSPPAEPKSEEVSGPEELLRFHRGIRTPDGKQASEYKPGYLVREWKAAQTRSAKQSRTMQAPVLEWKERGPNNVPGRTRGLAIDPTDPDRKTWYAGSAGGGVWRTSDGGQNWVHLTETFPNLATTVVNIAPSDANTIYAGTGEGYGNLNGIQGSGIFVTSDKGETWNWLPATSSFGEINRMVVNPADKLNIVVAANTGIYRTTDGGQTWEATLERTGVQDLDANPQNFSVLYATENGFGVYKSVDGGMSWQTANSGMTPNGRVELAISPVQTNTIYAAAEGDISGPGSDLYRSDDGGASWYLVQVLYNETDLHFLTDQGWYDNTIICDPNQPDVVYVGGVNLFRISCNPGFTTRTTRGLIQDNTSFLQLVNFTNSTNGNYTLGAFASSNSIEVRFGPGRSQNAHRFLVPSGATSGVPDNNYAYQDYVSVPFEVWDTDRNQQLAVSFRDQDRNGAFNLLPDNTTGAATEQSREYIYIHDVAYNSQTPKAEIATAGGHQFRNMIFFWPVLAPQKQWPQDVTTSRLVFDVIQLQFRNSTNQPVSDAYGQFNGRNRFILYGTDMHPDQHNLLVLNSTAGSWQLLAANDGGIFLSNTAAQPGVNNGDWSMRGKTMKTSQFYGADKRPGSEEFFGGMQDNGTWKSSQASPANASSNYEFELGGDGFEVLWHQNDPRKLIGGSQNNNFSRSLDGGLTWASATSGLSGTHPFLSKLAGSEQNPDRIYTLSSEGVFKSENFGQTWTLTSINQNWGSGSSLDVEVSRANDQIVWAGSGMSTTGTVRNIHVSADGGQSFVQTVPYTAVTMGSITKLASHPVQSSTGYALFSFAGRPKILKTEDLGQTWSDISGFENGAPSSRGFPDVAVYCLLVHRRNPQLLWAGTELGLVESSDGGNNWYLREDFPKVSIWDLKERENVVVIATHGRGIWTAAMDVYQQTINFSQPSDVEETAVTFTLSASSTSGLNVTYTTTDTDRISIEGNRITILSPGTVTITANQGGSDLYRAAAPISRTFCILPRRPVITGGGVSGENQVLSTDVPAPVEWLRNGILISGASASTLEVGESGSYTVRYSKNGCNVQSMPVDVYITDIPNNRLDKLELWPNPGSGKIRFTYPSGFNADELVDLTCYDSQGRPAAQWCRMSPEDYLDVTDLTAGAYTILATQGILTARARFISTGR